MTATVDFDSDQFLQLLTDALRSGPASPAWHEAVGLLRAGGSTIAGADEYRLLLEARQHLESGREFRSVRAGPELTRKILAAVEADDGKSPRRLLPAPIVIASLAGAVAIVALILIAHLLWNSGGAPGATLADLQSQRFSQDVLSTSFDSDLPPGWKKIGPLDGSFNHEFSPPASVPAGDYQGCGIATVAALPAGACALEVTFRLADANVGVVTQVFLTDQPLYNDDRGITPHELVWELQPVIVDPTTKRTVNREQVVLPDGTFATGGHTVPKTQTSLTLRLSMSADYVLVDSDGQRLFAGRHELSAIAPRFAGIRFMRKGDVKSRDIPAIVSVRISKGS